jgi:hypothetical protein
MAIILFGAIPAYKTYRYMKTDPRDSSLQTINGYIQENVNKKIQENFYFIQKLKLLLVNLKKFVEFILLFN